MKLPVIFALLTALFWGLYGPVLGLARTAEHNPFKPYLLIGVAYLVWGILGGAIGMKYTQAPFSFSGDGLKWGLIAGSLGAFGALTLTLAMFSFVGKPRPEIVMPIVFGGAVTITALTNLFLARGQEGAHAPSPWMWIGIVGMAVCIVIVAYNTPHVAPTIKPSTPPQSSPGDASQSDR